MILFFWFFALTGFLIAWVFLIYIGFKDSLKLGFLSLFLPPASLYVAWKKSKLLFLVYVLVISFFASASRNLIYFAGLPKYSGYVVTDSRDSKIQYDFTFLEALNEKQVQELLGKLQESDSWNHSSSKERDVYKYVADVDSLRVATSGYLEGEYQGKRVKARGFLSHRMVHGFGTFEQRVTRLPYKSGLQTQFLVLEKTGDRYLSYLILELPKGLFLEIYELHKSQERPITQMLIDRISEVLRDDAQTLSGLPEESKPASR